MFARRIAIIGVVVVVVAMTVFFWQSDLFTAGVLLAVDLLLGLLLLAVWRQLAQRERDARRITHRREPQRRYASESPREDRRSVATRLPLAADGDGDA